MAGTVRNLVFILGDQLSPGISSLAEADKSQDVVLMCEVMAEASYVRHHKQKIALIFSAMRHFAATLREAGFHVRYTRIDDPSNAGSFGEELARAVASLGPETVRVTEPGEWRVLQDMLSWHEQTGTEIVILRDDRFVCSHEEFAQWAQDRKSLTMEYFYRQMRRKTGLLMNGDAPVGGRWNFDFENRKPASPDLLRPRREWVEPDEITREVISVVERLFPQNIGTTKSFSLAVTRHAAELALDSFLEHFLPNFGETQDAMLQDDPFLNHSLLSFYINIGFLDPLVVCRAVERQYLEGRAPLNATEGFIRQIIGWREYLRGVYWLQMPSYASANFFENTRPLPSFYWTGQTGMNCVATGFPRQPFTTGKPNMAAWKCLRPSV